MDRRGPDFFFVAEAAARPELIIDGKPGSEMRKLSGGDLWYGAAHIEPVGELHSFYYVINGAKVGGSEPAGAQRMVVCAARRSGGQAVAENRAYQQDL